MHARSALESSAEKTMAGANKRTAMTAMMNFIALNEHACLIAVSATCLSNRTRRNLRAQKPRIFAILAEMRIPVGFFVFSRGIEHGLRVAR